MFEIVLEGPVDALVLPADPLDDDPRDPVPFRQLSSRNREVEKYILSSRSRELEKYILSSRNREVQKYILNSRNS